MSEPLGLCGPRWWWPRRNDDPGFKPQLDEFADRIDALQAENARLTSEVARLRSAISWALGEGDSDFGDHLPTDSKPKPYWWRAELSRRAKPCS